MSPVPLFRGVLPIPVNAKGIFSAEEERKQLLEEEAKGFMTVD